MGQLNASNNIDIFSPLKNKLDNEHLKECLKEKLTKITSEADGTNRIEMKELGKELNGVALEWKSSRNMSECKCSTTFDAFNKKVNYVQIFKIKCASYS